MQITRILQAVVLMLIIALAASCTASKEYTSKIFSPRYDTTKISQAKAFRFLEIESLENEKEGWVTTDLIMGKDSVSNTTALDKLSITFPADNRTSNSDTTKKENVFPLVSISKSDSIGTEPQVVKNYYPGEVRNKKIREK